MLGWAGHPSLALLWAVPVAWWFGRYTPAEVTELQRLPLFLQGSTDWGGACLFSATMALYVVLGSLASFYFTTELARHGRVGRALWSLRFHALLFLWGGTANLGYDTRITPNDFRNMALLAAVIYAASVVWITVLARIRLPLWVRMALAPALLGGWLWLGADGTTAKAGQIVYAGRDPVPVVRSPRHAVMLEWHTWCDRQAGPVPRSTRGDTFHSALHAAGSWVPWLLVVALLDSAGRMLRRRSGISLTRFWRVVVLWALFVCGAWYGAAYLRIRAVLGPVTIIHQSMESIIRAADIDVVQTDPAWQEPGMNLVKKGSLSSESLALLDAMKRGVKQTPVSLAIRVLIPRDDGTFIFLWATPSFVYADCRPLRRGGTYFNDIEVVEKLLGGERRYGGSAWEHFSSAIWYRPKILVGSNLEIAGGHVIVLTGQY